MTLKEQVRDASAIAHEAAMAAPDHAYAAVFNSVFHALLTEPVSASTAQEIAPSSPNIKLSNDDHTSQHAERRLSDVRS